MKYQKFWASGSKSQGLENLSLWQRLNSFALQRSQRVLIITYISKKSEGYTPQRKVQFTTKNQICLFVKSDKKLTIVYYSIPQSKPNNTPIWSQIKEFLKVSMQETQSWDVINLLVIDIFLRFHKSPCNWHFIEIS